jgi:hypothetical protein
MAPQGPVPRADLADLAVPAAPPEVIPLVPPADKAVTGPLARAPRARTVAPAAQAVRVALASSDAPLSWLNRLTPPRQRW